jgi:hypothetical protein
MGRIVPTDLHTTQRREVRVVSLATVFTWLVVPAVTGVLTGSLLLAGVAFAVWVSLTTVVLGIWVSSLTVAPSTPVTHQTRVSPQGWILPAGVTRRSEIPEDLAQQLDTRRMVSAGLVVALALLGFIVTILMGIGSQVDAGVTILFACGYWSIFGIGFVWLSVTSIRHGGPRPSIDRLSMSIGLVLPLYMGTLIWLGAAIVKDSGWTDGDVIGLLLLVGAIASNIWWIVETDRRWKLTYTCSRVLIRDL